MPRLSSSSRAKDSKSKSQNGSTNKKEQSRWIFIVNDEIINTDNAEVETQPTLCKLRHPRLGTGALFLMSSNSNNIYELNCFKEKYRSWFIGNAVQSDGQIYLTSPLDPLFLVLPYLMNEEKSKRFMTLDQLIEDEDFPDCHKLQICTEKDQLALISDVKDLGDMTVYRYNNDKTLAWLKAKSEAVADALELKAVNVSAKGSHSAIFVRSKNSQTSRDSYLEYALGIVSDILPLDLENALKTFIGLPCDNEKASTLESTYENEPPNKKSKLMTDITPTEDYSNGRDLKAQKSKPTKLTLAQKKLSKVDKKGMKSISSFFAPKS